MKRGPSVSCDNGGVKRTRRLAVTVLAAAMSVACHQAPAPPFEALGDHAVERFRAAFNARPDATRVVALLSPT